VEEMVGGVPYFAEKGIVSILTLMMTIIVITVTQQHAGLVGIPVQLLLQMVTL